jgi:ADP-heptose:LPS heptosyltransferase
VLLTTPLARAVHQGLPGVSLHWLVSAKLATALDGLPFVDRIVSFEKRDFFVRPWRVIGMLAGLRRERYDAAIDASHWHAFSFTSAALVWASGAPMRIGHERGESPRFLTHPVRHEPRAGEVESKLELLAPLGVAAAGSQLETRLGLAESQRVGLSRMLDAAGIPVGRRIALNPGGRKPDHRWSPEGFAAVARRLASSGWVPVVYWGPGEQSIARQVVAASSGAAHLAPATDVPQLAAAFRVSDWVITNDTGPMHLAAAVGARTVAIGLTRDATRWMHDQPGFVTIQSDGTEQTVDRIVQAIEATSAP